MAMIGDPTRRRAAAVDHGPEDQEVLDELVELECSVREQAMITDGYTEASESRKKKGKTENLGSRQREQKQADDSQEMNQDKVKENRTFARGRFPKRPVPRSDLLNGSLTHVTSCSVISSTRPTQTDEHILCDVDIGKHCRHARVAAHPWMYKAFPQSSVMLESLCF